VVSFKALNTPRALILEGSAVTSSPRAPDRDSIETPSEFGPYQVVREIGRGGMAFVYEGRHPKLESRVALKVLHPVLAAQPASAARFLREAEAASQIRHQNVVEVFDVGIEDGLPFIVMEFLEGADLATLLAENGPMPLKGIVEIFLPVISAVATAHRAGVIHRDLKPANLMLARRPPWSSQPVVLDFGISKVQSDDLEESKLTRSEALLGTVPYMAPEVTKGAKLASAASDQYALGVMLYECATGKRPFDGESQYELMHAIVTAKVSPPSFLAPTLPAEFDELVMKAMHRDPAKRYASLVDMGSALLSLSDDVSFAKWKDVFLGDDQAQNPWTVVSHTLNDADDVLLSRPRAKPAGKMSLAAWGFLAMSCVAASTTLALVSSRRATATRDLPEGALPSASATVIAAPTRPPDPVDKPAITADTTPMTTANTVSSAVEPVGSATHARRAPPIRSGLRPEASTSVAAPPATSAGPKASPARGTNGALIVE